MTSIDELQHLHLNEICGIATYEAIPAHYPIHNIGRRHSGLLYTLEGEEIYTFSGKTLHALPDSVLYIPKGEQYTITLRGEKSTVIYFDFEADNADSIRPFLVNSGSHSGVRSIFFDSEKEWRRRRSESFSACLSNFYKIISTLIRHEERYSNTASYEKISDAVLYLHAHYTDADFKIKELAKMSGISPRYFEMLFFNHVKMSPKEYVLHLKIALAKELLLGEKNTVTSVASQLGFNDIYHFSRIFKIKTGYTPTQYKQTFS
jgi:AraC-like DNA-binding protein